MLMLYDEKVTYLRQCGGVAIHAYVVDDDDDDDDD